MVAFNGSLLEGKLMEIDDFPTENNQSLASLKKKTIKLSDLRMKDYNTLNEKILTSYATKKVFNDFPKKH